MDVRGVATSLAANRKILAGMRSWPDALLGFNVCSAPSTSDRVTFLKLVARPFAHDFVDTWVVSSGGNLTVSISYGGHFLAHPPNREPRTRLTFEFSCGQFTHPRARKPVEMPTSRLPIQWSNAPPPGRLTWKVRFHLRWLEIFSDDLDRY